MKKRRYLTYFTFLLLFNQTFAQTLLQKTLLKDLDGNTNNSTFTEYLSVNDSVYLFRKSNDYKKIEIYRITNNALNTEQINEIDAGMYDSFINSGLTSIIKHNNNLYYTLNNGTNHGGLWKFNINSNDITLLSATTENLQKNFIINNKIYFWEEFGNSFKYINESNQVNNLPNLYTFEYIHQVDTLNNSFYIRAKYQGEVKWFRYSFDGTNQQELPFLNNTNNETGFFNNHIYALINNFIKIFDTNGVEIASYPIISYANEYFSNKFIELNNRIYLFTGNKIIDVTNPLQPPQLLQSYDNNLLEFKIDKRSAYFFLFKNNYYFFKGKNLQKIELFKTDLSFLNSQKINELLFNFDSHYYPTAHEVVKIDTNKVFLSISGRYLYAATDKVGSAILLDSISSASTSSISLNHNLIKIGSKLLYQSYELEYGIEMKITDGKSFGKNLFRDFNSTTNNSYPHNFQKLNNQLFFFAKNNINELKYWKSDGTKEGTKVFIEDFSNSRIGETRKLLKVGKSYYFVDGNRFYKYDSDLKTTTLLKVFSDLGYDLEDNLLLFDNHVYLKGYQYPYGYTLWKSDGTPSGTTLVNNSSSTTSFLVSSSKLFFFKETTFEDAEIWQLPNSHSNPTLMKSIHGIIRYNYADNNIFFFTTIQYNPFLLYQLYRSDGTLSGTYSLISNAISSDLIDYYDKPMFKFKNQYYFNSIFDGNDTFSPLQLWKTDGTITGTIKVNNNFNFFINYCECNGNLYLNGYNYSHLGRELFKIDGNTGAVQMVQDINPDWRDSSPYNFRCVNNKLYFNAWQSDLAKITDPLGIFVLDDGNITKLFEYDFSYNDPYYNYYSGFEFIGNNKLILSQYFNDKGIELGEINLNCIDNLSLNAINISQESYSVNNKITSTQRIESNAFSLYQARKAIELLPGFKVDKNSYFTTELKGCQ